MKITWSLCERMMDAYKIHPDRLKVDTPSGEKTLRALNIAKQQLEDLVDTSIPASSKTVGATLLFGVREADLDKDQADQKFTVILAGLMDCNGEDTINPNKLYNHFDPCPSTCPKIPDTSQPDDCP